MNYKIGVFGSAVNESNNVIIKATQLGAWWFYGKWVC